MTRFEGPAYVATGLNGAVTKDAEYSVWTAQVSGTRLTTILNWDSSPSGGVIKSDDLGRVRFIDPENRDLVYIQDSAGNRWPMASVETFSKMGQAITSAATAITAAENASGVAATANTRSITASTTADQAVALATEAILRQPLVTNVRNFFPTGIDPAVTDVTSAFQQALDTLETLGGGTLLVPPGRYLLGSNPDADFRSPVILRSVNPVLIDGTGATIVKTSATFRAVFVSNNRPGTTPGYGAGAQNVTVRGFRFEGNFAAGLSMCPLALHHARNIVVEDCTFYGSQGRGGHSLDLAGCEQIRVRRCQFVGQDISGSTSTVAEAVQIDKSQNGSLTSGMEASGFSGVFTRDVTVEDCQFLPLTIGSTVYPCPTPMGCHILMEGRYIEDLRFLRNLVVDPRDNISDNDNNDSSSSYYRGVLHFPCARNLHISGNTIRQTVPSGRPNRVITVFGKASGPLATSDPASVSPATGAWATPNVPRDIWITDNLIEGFKVGTGETGQEAIYVRGTTGDGNGSGDVRNVTVRGNVIRDGYNSAAADNRAAIRLYNVTDFTVDKNQVSSYAVGMLLDLARSGTVSGRWSNLASRAINTNIIRSVTFSDNFGVSLGAELIQLTLANGCTITGNSFRAPAGTGNNANGIILVSGDTIVCTGNSILNDTGTTQPRGIAVGGSLTNSLVTSNVITGYTAKVSGTPGSNVTTTGNI